MLINCMGYQNINSHYKTPPHTFESDVYSELCPDCQSKLRELWITNLFDPLQRTMSFSNFRGEHHEPSVVLWGKYGVGKTHLAISIARKMIEDYPMNPPKCPVAFITESDMLDRIRASFTTNKDSEHKIISELVKPDLLILDDVGKVTPQNHDFLQRIMFLLIDRIYRKNSKLILTTNLGMADLVIHIGESCVSRLHEMCSVKEIKGVDARIT